MRDLAIVLVNFRCEAHTLACLEHLAATLEAPPGEVVVVDNSPTEALERALARAPLRVRHLAMPSNLGFAAAANRGIAVTRSPLVLLLNPDARPLPGCVEGLVARLRSDRRAGAAGPVLLPFDEGGRQQPSATRVDPGLVTALVEYTVLHRLAGRGWLASHYFVAAEGGDEPDPVACAMVQGACLALRRQAVEAVGAFDAERFFLYWEETDLERRMRRAGWRILYCRDLACRHLGGASLGPGLRQDEAHFWRGFYAYHRRHGGPLRELALRLLLLPGIAAELAVLVLLALVRRHRDAKLLADLEVVRRRLRHQLPGRSAREAR